MTIMSAIARRQLLRRLRAGAAAESPFHAGELAAQERAGVRERMDVDARRGIRDYMPEQHRLFFAEQPFMVLGGVDRPANRGRRCGSAHRVLSPRPMNARCVLPDEVWQAIRSRAHGRSDRWWADSASSPPRGGAIV